MWIRADQGRMVIDVLMIFADIELLGMVLSMVDVGFMADMVDTVDAADVECVTCDIEVAMDWGVKRRDEVDFL